MDIGKKIKLLRISNKLTQEELSEKVNVSVVSVRCWEAGSKLPSLKALVSLSTAFGISSDELIGLNTPPYQNEALDISDREAVLIMDFRNLDDYGKKAVESVCAIEKERLTSVNCRKT